MLGKNEALAIAKKAFREAPITKCVPYKGLYVLQIFVDRPGEEGMDPFYSVNQSTGEFRDFSVLTDGGPDLVKLLEGDSHASYPRR